MFMKSREWLVHILIGIILVVVLWGCIGVSEQNPQTEERHYPTVFITPLVTQIIATRPAATSTPEEEPTPIPIDDTSWNPLKVAAYYPIRGCVASRLHIGDAAFVSYNGGKMGVYPSKDIEYAPLVRMTEPGEAFVIVDGPWCVQNTLVWEVKTTDEEDSTETQGAMTWKIANYVPEGNGEQYWLLPLQTNPGIPTPKPTSMNAYVLRLKAPKGCGRR